MVLAAHVEVADGGPARGWFHPRATRAFRGPGPVEVVSVHRLEPPGADPHWHLVTYGLTELEAKTSPDRDRSGWGFELTVRLPAPDEDLPLWGVDFLASMASYVWSYQHPFAPYHLVDLRGPIRLGADTRITAALVLEDPGLHGVEGPFGRVDFLQLVGLSAAELELCRAWSPEGVGELLARRDRWLVTDLDRPELTDAPQVAVEVADRVARDGSSLHELRVGTLEVERKRGGAAVVTLGAGAAAALGPALRRELIASGASFAVTSDRAEVRFVAGESPSWRWMGEGIEAVVALDGLEYVAALFDGRTGWGRATDWPGLRFRVVP
jgi:suppressor of fused-like protein